MASWPEVRAVSGVEQALERLDGHFRLVVGSNAGESDESQVLAALQRVSLRQYFTRAFTPRELHAQKPGLQYFRALEAALGETQDQLCMVGDDLWVDIHGAWQAGWKSIWFNRKATLYPGLAPPYDAEILQMADLPSAIGTLGLPGSQQCQIWLAEQGASLNLLQHVQMVAGISYLLACWLRAAGQTVNPVLAHRGGLLHDLARISARHIAPNVDHGEVAASLLREYGQPELAEIAHRHVLDRLFDPALAPRTWEEKIVHFADKLVEAGKVVDLQTRLDALSTRYHQRAEGIRSTLPLLDAMQDEISAAAGISSVDLVKRLQAVTFNGKITTT